MTATVEEIRTAMETHRAGIRGVIWFHLLGGATATTTQLRALFRDYDCSRSRRAAFWNRLRELETAGFIARAGIIQEKSWLFPTTIWRLTNGHEESAPV